MEPSDQLRTIDPLNAEWVTIVLLGVLIALAVTNVSSPRKWRLLLQAMFSMRLGRQALREEIDLQDRTLLGLILVSVIVLGLFIWQAGVLLAPTEVRSFPYLAGIVLLVLLAQGLLLRTLANLAGSDRGITEYLSTGLLLFILTGVSLLPLVVLVAYRSEWRPVLLVIGAALVVLLLLYRWIRGTWVGLAEGVPIRYLILYLCAAEAAPVLLLIHAWHASLIVATTP